MKKYSGLGKCSHGVSFDDPCDKCEIISLKCTIELFTPIVDNAIDKLEKLKKKYPQEFKKKT